MKILLAAILIIAIPFSVSAEQFCMEVDPERIALIEQVVPLRNARMGSSLSREAYISAAVKRAVEHDLRLQVVLDSIAEVEARQATLEEIVIEQRATREAAVDAQMGDW